MALIKCRECGHQISDEAINCVYCGCPIKNEKKYCKNCNNMMKEKGKTCSQCRKKRKKKIYQLALIIFLILVTTIIATILMVSATNNKYLYNYDGYYYHYYLLYGIIALIVNFICVIVSIIFEIKLFKNKEHISKKIIILICILVSLISSFIYIPKRLYAKKINYNISIKTLVESDYNIKQSQKIWDELYDILFTEAQIDKNEDSDNKMKLIGIGKLTSEGYRKFSFSKGYYEDFSLYIKISNEKIKSIYWLFNEKQELKIFFYNNYQKNDNIDYYSKVITSEYSERRYNYDLRISITKDIKKQLKSPSTAIVGEYILYYNKYGDEFYYLVDVDSQNIYGSMIRTTFRIDLTNTHTHRLNYKISVAN